MNENIVAFYSRIRGDHALIAELSEIDNTDAMTRRAVEIGAGMGLTFTQEEAKTGLMNLQDIIDQVSNDDELSDMELEIVAAGTHVANGSTHTKGSSDV